MPNPYVDIFRAPGAKAFSAAGFVARLPQTMMTLGIVTMLSQRHGEYWLAGGVSATFALANALIAPQISRQVDRYGQSRVLIPVTTVTVTSLAALILATHYNAATWMLFLFAAIAGSMPSITALVRARWTVLYRDTPKLHTAFAFESVIDETLYMIGPVVSIGLSVVVFPEAGPLVATLLLAIGTIFFAAQRATEPPVHSAGPAGGSSVIRLGSLQIIMATLAAIGAIFGAADVTAVAFAEAQGQKAAAGLALTSYAAGSLIAGLVFGMLKIKLPLPQQLLMAVSLAALTTLPLLAVNNIPTLAAVLFLAGGAVSPTIITSMGLIERLAPPSKLTEGITWAITGIGIGAATGSALSGWMIDKFGAPAGFWVSIPAGAIALVIALLGYRHLLRQAEKAMSSACCADDECQVPKLT